MEKTSIRALLRAARAMALPALLAGCAVLAGVSSDGPPLPGSAEARFVPGRSVDVIEVTVTDPLALRRADLVGPDGTREPAYSIDANPSPTSITPLGGGPFPREPGMPVVVSQLDSTVSNALIRLPDPWLYGRDWRNSRIELHLGDPGGMQRDMTLPAPPPPAGSPALPPLRR
jgi:hypothetical protein